jgi:Na+-transporting NADH:ubiquinone oxidoreductase subunit C
MKNFSNTYIFLFAAVMVILVAALLSVVALQLKPIQDRNVRTEQIQNILATVQIESTTKNADSLYKKYIVKSFVVNASGDEIKNAKALDIDLKKEADKIALIKKLKEQLVERRISPFKKFMNTIIASKEVNKEQINARIEELHNQLRLPVYVCNKGGKEYYIFALRGKGLWGPIWGYISLDEDLNTIYGAKYDHKSETPGLGAKIKDKWFEDSFKGKKIFDKAHEFKSIKVAKGEVDPNDPYSVNAISGATITSKGVQAMIRDFLESYLSFIESIKQK